MARAEEAAVAEEPAAAEPRSPRRPGGRRPSGRARPPSAPAPSRSRRAASSGRRAARRVATRTLRIVSTAAPGASIVRVATYTVEARSVQKGEPVAATNINRVVITGNLTRDPSCAPRPVAPRSAACASPSTAAARTSRASGSTSPTTSTSPSGARRARTAPSTWPRAAPSRSTAASTGASGRPRTAPSGSPWISLPTRSSSWARATRPRTQRRGRVRPARRHLRLPAGRSGERRRLGRRHPVLAGRRSRARPNE